MIFKETSGNPAVEEAIDLIVLLSATDANSEKKWRGFYHFLSMTELQEEWNEYVKT